MKDLLSNLDDFAPPIPFKARTSDDWKKLSRPVLDFVDAKTDEALVDYVKKYGPVLAWACTDGYEVVAAQSLAVLRREQKIFAMAFELKEALGNISQKDTTDLDDAWAKYEPLRDQLITITEAHLRSHTISASDHKTLIRNCDNAQQELHDLEVKLRPKFERVKLAATTLAMLVIEAGQAPMEEYPKEIIPHDIWWGVEFMVKHQPAWECSAFSSLPLLLKDAYYQAALSLGRGALCTILDEFPPKLFVEGKMVEELPHTTLFGIRPALYFMLRRYFRMGKALFACERCGTSFFSENARKRVRFCGAYCSRLQRQSEYYFKTVKQRRKETALKKKQRLQAQIP